MEYRCWNNGVDCAQIDIHTHTRAHYLIRFITLRCSLDKICLALAYCLKLFYLAIYLFFISFRNFELTVAGSSFSSSNILLVSSSIIFLNILKNFKSSISGSQHFLIRKIQCRKEICCSCYSRNRVMIF